MINLLLELRKLAEDLANTAFEIVEKRLLTSKSPAIDWSLNALEKTYKITDAKRRKIECKRLKLLLFALQKLKPGVLMRTKSEILTRTSVSIENLAERKWKTIPEDEYVMYLDVVYDQNYDIATLQILWKEKVLYLHHNNKLGEDFSQLGNFFEFFKAR